VTRYLLDTNAIADLIRHPNGPIARRIAEVGQAEVCTSIIVAAEVRYGAAKRKSSELSARCEAALQVLDVLPFAAPADDVYARMRAQLQAAGRPIGSNDMLIAAHALTLGFTIVTDNEREFSRVPGLAYVNWLRGR
jgi:tRNA(fMet)-specific endonuclease VapC